jgi:hypothetical protein
MEKLKSNAGNPLTHNRVLELETGRSGGPQKDAVVESGILGYDAVP